MDVRSGSRGTHRYLRLTQLRDHPLRKGFKVDDFPHRGPIVNELSEEYTIVRRMALEDRRIVKYMNGVYMFVPPCGSWLHVRSVESAKYLASAVGLDNVSVNFMTATEMYSAFAEKVAPSCGTVPRSVCIGTWRLHVTLEDSSAPEAGIKMAPVFMITGRPSVNEVAKRVTGLCISPIRIGVLTQRVRKFSPSAAEKSLSNVMTSDNLRLLRWVIGNGLIDPVDKPKAVYMFGNGGEGKSCTINTILANLPGAVYPLSKDYVGSNLTISQEDLTHAMSVRFISYGDVVLKKSKINAAFWKMITGGDTMRVSSGQGRLSCTALFASNNLWYPISALLKKWFVRRTIVILLHAPSADDPPPPNSFSDLEIHDFVTNCIYERLRTPFVPCTIQSSLLTIFGYKISVATRGITLGNKTSELGSISATWAVSIAGEVEYELLTELVECMSNSLVSEYHGVKYLKGIETSVP